jgi:hypothetical protein
MADNFNQFRPRKNHVIWELRLAQSDELDALIEGSGLSELAYDKRWKRYRIHLLPSDVKNNEEVIAELIKRARGLAGGEITTGKSND